MANELVPNPISHDVVEALEVLLAGARQGHVTGIVYAAALKRQRHIVSTAGSCDRNLTHARGMLLSLNDTIGQLLRQRDAGDTR